MTINSESMTVPIAINVTPLNIGACLFCANSTNQVDPLIVSADHSVVLCEACGIYQTHPFPNNTAAFYQESYYSRQKSRRFTPILEWSIRLFRWVRARDINRRYKGGRILDIGCGRGLSLYFLKTYFNWEVQGTQISQTAYEYATDVLKVPVFLGDLLKMPPKKPFTVVTMYHVLEHVVDPKLYLNEINRILEIGGACVIEVPNTDSLSARATRAHWFGWDLPYHTYHFGTHSLTKLLEQTGFKIEHVKHWSMEFNTFVVLQSALNLIFKEKDYFFRLLQRKARISHRPLHALTCLFLGVVFTPVAFVIALVGSLVRKGEVIRFYCRKTA